MARNSYLVPLTDSEFCHRTKLTEKRWVWCLPEMLAVFFTRQWLWEQKRRRTLLKRNQALCWWKGFTQRHWHKLPLSESFVYTRVHSVCRRGCLTFTTCSGHYAAQDFQLIRILSRTINKHGTCTVFGNPHDARHVCVCVHHVFKTFWGPNTLKSIDRSDNFEFPFYDWGLKLVFRFRQSVY